MKKIVIMPGGFHPFHAGHMALYNAAKEAFPSADVFVAATDDKSSRPFSFKAKKFLAQQAGVPAHRFIQVKSPFAPEEIKSLYPEDDTVLIFVRSEKDRMKPPQAGGVKKDGTASYLQPYRRNGLQPMSQHGYMVYLPTVQFGPGMTSATEIRGKWPEMTPEEKISLVKVLYPSTVSKDAAAGKIVAMFDQVMAPATEPEIKEATVINDPDAGTQIRPAGGMGTWNEASMVSDLARRFADMAGMLRARNYKGVYHELYKSRWTADLVRALAEYEAFQKKQGQRPMAPGREIDITDYLDEKNNPA